MKQIMIAAGVQPNDKLLSEDVDNVLAITVEQEVIDKLVADPSL